MEERDIITTKHHTRINRCCPYQRSKKGECASFWNTHFSGKQRMRAIEGFIAKYEGCSFDRCLSTFVNDPRFKESKGWKMCGTYYSPRSYFDWLFEKDYEVDENNIIHCTRPPKTKRESCNSLSFKALQFSAQADRGQDSQGGTSKTMGVPSKDPRDTQRGPA